MAEKLTPKQFGLLVDVLALESILEDSTQLIDPIHLRGPVNLNSIFVPGYTNLNDDSYSN